MPERPGAFLSHTARKAPRVLHLGPDPEMGGGMASALRGLLESPLGERYELEVVPTYRGTEPLRRYAAGLVVPPAVRAQCALQ